MKKRLLVLSIAVMMLLPNVALAKGYHHGGSGIDDMYFGKVHFLFQHKDEIGLSDAQIEQIKAIKFDVKRAMVNLKAKKKLAMIDFKQELGQDSPELAKLEASIDQKMAAKTSLAKISAKAILDTKALLSVDQRAKAKALYWQMKYSARS